jgi:hypothetical protein
LALSGALLFNFTQNDVKPVVFINVKSSTGSAISAAAYNLIDRNNPGTSLGSGAMLVSGSTISTPNLTWPTLGTFVVQCRVTFVDGVIDNSIEGYVTIAVIGT